MSEAAAVDVESFEDFQNRVGRDAPVMGPHDDVEILLTCLQPIEDAIEEN